MSSSWEVNRRAFRFYWRLEPVYWILFVIQMALQNGKKYLQLFLTGALLSELASGPDMKKAAFRLMIIPVSDCLVSLLNRILSKYLGLLSVRMDQKEAVYKSEKAVRIDYREMEKGDYRQLQRRIREASYVNSYGKGLFLSLSRGIIGIVTELVFGIVFFVYVCVSMIRAEGSIWIPLAFVIIILGLTVCKILYKEKAAKTEKDVTMEFTQKFTEANRLDAAIDGYKMGKDVRLFSLGVFFLKIHEELTDKRVHFMAKLKKKMNRMAVPRILLEKFQKITAYVFVGRYVLLGSIPVGSIWTYVGYVDSFFRSAEDVASVFNGLKENAPFLEQYFSRYDYPEYKQNSKLPDTQYSRFLDVNGLSFRYDNTDKDAVSDVTFNFEKGKSYAVVGKNGSGKTTFVKVLCNLYNDIPEKSVIYHGSDIRDLGKDLYWENVSTVFQDFKLLSFELGQVVASARKYDEEKMLNVFKNVGFEERCHTLQDGLKTHLYKNYNENGVEFSGGEAQKIAMARALYKDSEILIMDEPTAALDPEAEIRIYENFHKITGDRTVFYISHRLASCKFCDCILVMDEGKLVQSGSHSELLKDREGLYYRLWEAQAEQYMIGN